MAEGPVLDQLNLVVSDMEAAVTFYRRLGLTIPDTDPAFVGHHRTARLQGGIDLDFDSTEFARHWDKGWRAGAGVIGFKVDSRERVDAIYADTHVLGATRRPAQPTRRHQTSLQQREIPHEELPNTDLMRET